MSDAKPMVVRPPLALPTGSVRAILTLIVVAVVIVELARAHDLQVLWTETLMIVLAHYFTSRRLIQLPREVVKELKAEGRLEEEAQPLFLPRHTIRLVIVLAFLGLAVWLYQRDRFFTPQPLSIFGTLTSYVLGVVFKGAVTWWNRKTNKLTPAWWGDAKAVVVLAALIVTAGALLMGQPDLVPEQVQKATFALVLFYFGSR
jgi:hypothetical protein